jgi:tripartite-type tricarboxylate transporter receptor subunit TctC
MGIAGGQEYPNRTIRFVTTPAGGSTDVTARHIAQGISGPLGQQVIVENRPGSVIPAQVVAAAPPDGYTILVVAGFWIGPLLQKTTYEVL